MPSQKRKFGDLGESIGQEYLVKKGYQIIEKNYLKPWGEIDIIAKKNGAVIFFEVKTRDKKNVEHYPAEFAINRDKIRKLQKTCETYLSERRYGHGQEWQIDVLAISIEKQNMKAIVDHIENAVWEKIY